MVFHSSVPMSDTFTVLALRNCCRANSASACRSGMLSTAALSVSPGEQHKQDDVGYARPVSEAMMLNIAKHQLKLPKHSNNPRD